MPNFASLYHRATGCLDSDPLSGWYGPAGGALSAGEGRPASGSEREPTGGRAGTREQQSSGESW